MAFWNPTPIITLLKDQLGIGEVPGELITIEIDDGSQLFRIQYRRFNGIESLIYG
jgi:hypothetical protein